MPEEMKYRFVRFRTVVTLRVPWAEAERPEAVAAQHRERELKIHCLVDNPEVGNVFDMVIGTARTFDRASDLDSR